jgi:RNA polymerase sigma-70 factor, ECF subfamily
VTRNLKSASLKTGKPALCRICNQSQISHVILVGDWRVADDEIDLHRWMVLAQDGDGAATSRLLTALAPRLRAFFRGKGASSEDAEDLVQETLIAIYTKRAMFDPGQRLLSWTYAIARYRMIDRWRHTKRRGHELPIEDFEHVLMAQQPEAGDPKRDIARLLATLPNKQRTAIELVKIKDMSINEACAATGWTASDIKISIHRGLKSLMALVGDTETAFSNLVPALAEEPKS